MPTPRVPYWRQWSAADHEPSAVFVPFAGQLGYVGADIVLRVGHHRQGRPLGPYAASSK
jgi:hypothetical protein